MTKTWPLKDANADGWHDWNTLSGQVNETIMLLLDLEKLRYTRTENREQKGGESQTECC